MIKVNGIKCRNIAEQVCYNDQRIRKLENNKPEVDFVKYAYTPDEGETLYLDQVVNGEETVFSFQGGSKIKAGSNITITQDPETKEKIISASGEISGTVNFLDIQGNPDDNIALKAELEGIRTLVESEASDRQAADTTLQNNINEEAALRENADGVLDTKIDTKQDKLTSASEIEVKQIGMGRYNINEGLFTQINEAVETLNENKQNKLTAGTNITIDENNVISAAGGTAGVDDIEFKTDPDNSYVTDMGWSKGTTTTWHPLLYVKMNGTENQLYGTAFNDDKTKVIQKNYAIGQNAATPNAITMSNETGNIYTAYPTELTQATNKGYVDTALLAKLDATMSTIQTTAPTAAATDGGIHIVILDDEPTTKYDGYIYMITEA